MEHSPLAFLLTPSRSAENMSVQLPHHQMHPLHSCYENMATTCGDLGRSMGMQVNPDGFCSSGFQQPQSLQPISYGNNDNNAPYFNQYESKVLLEQQQQQQLHANALLEYSYHRSQQQMQLSAMMMMEDRSPSPTLETPELHLRRSRNASGSGSSPSASTSTSSATPPGAPEVSSPSRKRVRFSPVYHELIPNSEGATNGNASASGNANFNAGFAPSTSTFLASRVIEKDDEESTQHDQDSNAGVVDVTSREYSSASVEVDVGAACDAKESDSSDIDDDASSLPHQESLWWSEEYLWKRNRSAKRRAARYGREHPDYALAIASLQRSYDASATLNKDKDSKKTQNSSEQDSKESSKTHIKCMLQQHLAAVRGSETRGLEQRIVPALKLQRFTNVQKILSTQRQLRRAGVWGSHKATLKLRQVSLQASRPARQLSFRLAQGDQWEARNVYNNNDTDATMDEEASTTSSESVEEGINSAAVDTKSSSSS